MMDNVDPYLRAKMTPGSLWRHPKSDRIYELLHLARTESHCEEVVVYRAVDIDGVPGISVWVRPLIEFAGRFRREERP